MKNLELDKIKLDNFPERLEKKDYQELCDLAVEDLRKNSNVLAVYLFGGDWFPGISDLDIIVVWKRGHLGRTGVRPPWRLSEKAKFVFVHRYESHNPLTFRDICYFLPRSDKIKLLFGKPFSYHLPQKELETSEYYWLQASFVFSFLINKFLLFPKYEFKNRIDVQEIILFINSLTYSIKAIQEISGSEFNENFCLRVGQLRKKWFERDRQENIKLLFGLLDEAGKISLKIVEELNLFLKREVPDFIKKIEGKRFFLRNPRYDLIFSPEWQEGIFLEGFKKGRHEFNYPFLGRRNDLDSYRLILPNSLFFFLLGYLKEKGPLSDWFRRGVRNNYFYLLDSINLNKGFQEHIRTVNNYVAESLRFDNKGFKLWLPFGFFPYQRSIKRKIIDFMILLRKSLTK